LELVGLIDELTRIYNVPVFLGGDLNGNSAGENYRHFVSDEVGYTDLNSSEIAEIFSSELRTNHGYPCYDTSIGMMQPGMDQESTQYSADSIDRILLTNFENRVQINIFAVISDDMSRSSSDHYPIMTDFRFISDDFFDGGQYTERY
jgi:endonuclease/exonuclease/phosphatase family metal-dependent hydrolase